MSVRDLVLTLNRLRKSKDPQSPTVFVSFEAAGPDLRQALADAGCELWDRTRLEAETGMAIVGLVERGEWPGSLLPAPPTPAVSAEPAPAGALPTHTIATIVAASATPLAAADAPRIEVFDDEDASAAQGPQEEIGPTATAKLTQPEARTLARQAMPKLSRLEPIKIPHYLFAYDVKLYGSPDKKEARGLLLVSAATGEPVSVPEEPTPSLSFDGKTLEIAWDQARAQQAAKETALAESTSENKVRTATSNAVIVSRKKIVPIEETLKLTAKGLWLIPAWRATGPQGTLLVNGLTGTVESEKRGRQLSSDAELFT